MNQALDLTAGVLLIVGCLMSLGAGVGIVRFSDVLMRLHAGAKPQVFGLLLLVIAIGLSARSWKMVPVLVLIWVLQLVVIPVSSHMVGRSGFRNKHFRPESLSHNELANLVEKMSEEDRQASDDAAPHAAPDDALDDNASDEARQEDTETFRS